MGTHANGAAFPVFCEANTVTHVSGFLWLLPNGTRSFVTLPSTSSMWSVSSSQSTTSPPFLYYVSFAFTSDALLFSAFSVNLTDATVASSPVSLSFPHYPEVYFEFSHCSFPLDASNAFSPIAFLGLWNSSIGSLIILDPITMSLSASSFFTLAPSDAYGAMTEQLRCGQSAIPSQYLVWQSSTTPLRESIALFVLDLTAKTLVPISIPHPEGYVWVDAHTTDSGSAVLCACDGVPAIPDNITSCRFYYYDTFNTSDFAQPDALVRMGPSPFNDANCLQFASLIASGIDRQHGAVIHCCYGTQRGGTCASRGPQIQFIAIRFHPIQPVHA